MEANWCQRREASLFACSSRILVRKQSQPSLHMLMDFPAGFAYSFFDSRLNDYYQPGGLDEFSGNYYDTVSQPLVNQPGEQWEYGINIDW
jgi:hypothetical protein